MSNVLDLFDQTLFRFEEATGVTSIGQCVWVYNRAIDIDGLRRFHRHLQRGRLSRRIERSALPFGRHRWVSPSDESELEIVATPRPREEFDTWLAEQAATRLDAEHGPGWHLAVLPFTDGGAGVSLVALHSLADGMAGCLAVVEAACGYDSAIDWPAAGSRRRWQALREDARQTARDLPGIRRAVVAAAPRHVWHGVTAVPVRPDRPARRRRCPPAPDEPVTLPTATIFIDADEWDARADALGRDQQHAARGIGRPPRPASGTRHRGRLGHLGHARQRAHRGRHPRQRRHERRRHGRPRTGDDGPARHPRGNQASADPPPRREPDERAALLPLVPLLPKRLAKRCVGVATTNATSVVLIQPRCRPPGRQPAGRHGRRLRRRDVSLPGHDQGDDGTRRRGAGLAVGKSARTGLRLGPVAYQPGRPNSKDDLQQALSSALSDFSLNRHQRLAVPRTSGRGSPLRPKRLKNRLPSQIRNSEK